MILILLHNSDRCPETHPFAYSDGKRCCETNKEKKADNQDRKCDGSVIQRDSSCCDGDKAINCPGNNCMNTLPRSKSCEVLTF